MEDNELKGSPFGTPPQKINVREDLRKLFRGLIGNRTVDPRALDDTIASQVKPEPVDLGNVIARPTPEQIADAIKDTKKKENIESIRVNLVEDPDKKTGIASLNVDDRKKVLESVMLDESGQNLIETVNMFKPNTKPFANRDVGKIYVSNVLDTVSSYIPDTFDKNKLKSLLMHTADKESTFGSDKTTYRDKPKKVKAEGREGTIGHGGIQQVTTKYGFNLNILKNPGPTAQKMINRLKEERGIDLNKIKTSKQPNTDTQNFLKTPFGSNFVAAIIYINALENQGKSGKAARDLYNSDKYNEKDFRDIFYKGIKKYDEVSNILKDDKIKESKTGGMIEKDPYKRQPRFI